MRLDDITQRVAADARHYATMPQDTPDVHLDREWLLSLVLDARPLLEVFVLDRSGCDDCCDEDCVVGRARSLLARLEEPT